MKNLERRAAKSHQARNNNHHPTTNQPNTAAWPTAPPGTISRPATQCANTTMTSDYYRYYSVLPALIISLSLSPKAKIETSYRPEPTFTEQSCPA